MRSTFLLPSINRLKSNEQLLDLINSFMYLIRNLIEFPQKARLPLQE